MKTCDGYGRDILVLNSHTNKYRFRCFVFLTINVTYLLFTWLWRWRYTRCNAISSSYFRIHDVIVMQNCCSKLPPPVKCQAPKSVNVNTDFTKFLLRFDLESNPGLLFEPNVRTAASSLENLCFALIVNFLKKIEDQPASPSTGQLPSSPTKDSSGIIHQLQSTVLKQQRELDRLRRTMSTTGEVLSLADDDSVSDIGDDDDLLFDATLTEDAPDDETLKHDAPKSGCETPEKSSADAAPSLPVLSWAISTCLKLTVFSSLDNTPCNIVFISINNCSFFSFFTESLLLSIVFQQCNALIVLLYLTPSAEGRHCYL